MQLTREVLELEYDKVETEILAFIRKTVKNSKASGVVIGLSGGIDSAVTGALLVRALGKSKVVGILMPASHTPKEDTEDARELARKWGIKTYQVPIDGVSEAFEKSLPPLGKGRIARANVKARIRMIINYYVGNSLNMLVAGTGDRSEDMVGFFCYDEKTRVVTNEGPKTYLELREADIVFSYDLASGKVVESKVGEVHIFDYNGKMVRFISDNLDLLVTPNHRMLVRSSSSGDYQYGKVEFRTAEECLKRAFSVIPVPVGWDGKEGISPSTAFQFTQRHIKRPVSVAAEDLLYLLGLFIGDGSATKGKATVPVVSNLSRKQFSTLSRDSKGHFVRIETSLIEPRLKTYDTYETDFSLPMSSKGGAREGLVALLDKYGIGRSFIPDLVRIPSKEIYEFFLQCGHGAKNKHIPTWALEYPSSYLTFLLKGLTVSDGNHSSPVQVYYTSSSRLKDDFVELCTKLGRFPTVRVRPARTSHYNGKAIRSSAQFEISYARKVKHSRWVTNSRTKKVHYAGKVWCPSAPPHENILVERNGRYVFCGNTKYGDGGVDFLPIAHLYKTQVRALGAHLGLPERVVWKPSSPQLWPGHKAVDELPVDYDKLDLILSGLLDKKLTPAEVAKSSGVELKVVDEVLRRYRGSAHKRAYPPMLGSW